MEATADHWGNVLWNTKGNLIWNKAQETTHHLRTDTTKRGLTKREREVKLQISATDKGVEPKYYRNALKQLLTMDEIFCEFQM